MLLFRALPSWILIHVVAATKLLQRSSTSFIVRCINSMILIGVFLCNGRDGSVHKQDNASNINLLLHMDTLSYPIVWYAWLKPVYLYNIT